MKKLLLFTLLLSGLYSTGQNISRKNSSTSSSSVSAQKIITATSWDEIEMPVNGFSRVLKQNKFTFTDASGKPISEPVYDGARNFSNHLVAVEKNGQWGFINETGKTIIPLRYEIVFDFTDHQTAVFGNKQWSILDQSGKILFSPDIDVCYGYKNGWAVIEKAGRKGLMDDKGNIKFTGQQHSAPSKRPLAPASGSSPNSCPNNLGFENANFTNWKCFTGYTDSIGTTNIITVTPSAPIANRHRIVTRSNPSLLDPFGLFPTNPPDGSNAAVRLGNTRIGAEAERIQYTIRVPQNDSNFSIMYDYAVVFQDPGHTTWSQPRFTARLFDSAANKYIDCASFEYISTSNLPGFALSTVDTSVIYKPWSTVFISLRPFAGKTMYLEFTTADCVRKGHWGYAYVDVQSSCGQSLAMQYDCNYPNETILDAPPGFEFYNWWNQDFTKILATGQHTVLNPGPPANSTIYVEMIPFNDFGCADTLSVKLTGGFKPSFDVSEKEAICAPRNIQFYNKSIPSVSAVWDFGDGNTATGDSVNHTYTSPGTYLVSLTVQLPSGCIGKTIDTIRILQPTATLNYSGGSYCNAQNIGFDVTGKYIDSLRYDFGEGNPFTSSQLITQHNYTTPGKFTPSVIVYFKGGCSTSLTGPSTIQIEKLVPDFQSTPQISCNQTTLILKDLSQSNNGIASYTWDYGDGTAGSGTNISHVYTKTGTYPVKLILTGNGGCRDSIIRTVNITVNKSPMADIIAPTVPCMNSALSFDLNIQSESSVASVNWKTSDGKTGNSKLFSNTFSQPGTYTVQAIVLASNGCSDTSNTAVVINPLPDISIISNQTVCNGEMTNRITLLSNYTNADIRWTNDNTSTGLAQSGRGDIAPFTAVNSGTSPAVSYIAATPSFSGCEGQSRFFILTVKPAPASINLRDVNVCNNEMVAAVNFSGNNTYTWSNNNTAIGLAASGNGNINAFKAVNTSTTAIGSTVIVTPFLDGCAGTPASFNIAVRPTPVMNANGNPTICNGAKVNTIQFTGNLAGTAYNWTNDNTSIGLAASGTGDIATFTPLNNTTQTITSNITVTPTLNGCDGLAEKITITVKPTPAPITTGDVSACNNETVAAINFNGPAVYTWTNSLSSIGLAASGSGNISAFKAVNTGTAAVTARISVTPQLNGCSGTTSGFNLTVKPTPIVSTAGNQEVCNGAPVKAIQFTGNTNGITYNWTNDNTTIGLAAAGSGDIASFIAKNSVEVPVLAYITVLPTLNGCAGESKKYKLTVNPTPVALTPADFNVCNKERIPTIDFIGSSRVFSVSEYKWINDLPSIGIPAAGFGNISSFVALNSGTTQAVANITITPVLSGCSGAPAKFKILVNPTPEITAAKNIDACNGTLVNAIRFEGNITQAKYNWTNTDQTIGIPASGTGDISAFNAVNTSAVQRTAYITVTPTFNGCSGDSKNIAVNVNPTPSVVASGDGVVCKGSSTVLSVSGAQRYLWSPSTGLSCIDCSNPTATLQDSVAYRVEGTNAYGCKAYDTVAMSVIKPFDMIVSSNDTICEGKKIQLQARKADRYQWSPPTGLSSTTVANPIASPTVNTQYMVIGYDNNNCFTDTGYVYITVGSNPQIELGPDITAATGTTVTFNPVVQGGPITKWSWTPAKNLSCDNCRMPTATVDQNRTYTLNVENRFGCTAQDNIVINVFCKSSQLFLPNAFTPDGDGLNDLLMIRGTGILVKSFRIFNRWGIMVFEKMNFRANDPKYAWDGKVKGVPAAPDVYVYVIDVTCDNGTEYMYKGNTTILK